MVIVSSLIVEDSPQQDGSRWIRELHRDDQGNDYPFQYMAPNATWDAQAVLADRAVQLAGGAF